MFSKRKSDSWGCRLVWSRLGDSGSLDPGSNPGSPIIDLNPSGYGYNGSARFKRGDTMTRHMFEEIVKQEEEHYWKFNDFLK